MVKTSLSIFNSRFQVIQRVMAILGIILMFFMMDRFIGQILTSFILNSEFRYSRLYRGGMNYDTVVIGNSRALNAIYSPYVNEHTSSQVINMSYNGLHPVMMRTFMTDYIERNSIPARVLIEVSAYAELLEFNGLRSVQSQTELNADFDNETYTDSARYINFLPYYSQSNRLRDVLWNQAQSHSIACEIATLYCFNGELTYRILYYSNQSDQNWIIRGTISSNLLTELQDIESVRFVAYRDPINGVPQLLELINILETNGIEPVLFLAPYFPKYADKIDNLNTYIRYIETETSYVVHNYAFALPDSAYFADYIHINRESVETFYKVFSEDGLLSSK